MIYLTFILAIMEETIYVGTCRCNVKGEPGAGKTGTGRVPMCSTGAELFVVVMKVL